jgi:hypothetical protein
VTDSFASVRACLVHLPAASEMLNSSRGERILALFEVEIMS